MVVTYIVEPYDPDKYPHEVEELSARNHTKWCVYKCVNGVAVKFAPFESEDNAKYLAGALSRNNTREVGWSWVDIIRVKISLVTLRRADLRNPR